ncbi:putative alcohol dehydrogenase [Penaeus vannamei]|uniref:Putative alcohol dehydrogenase n=1 Tax=Penaeus vannamei TaxID=6689 RepID=A0A423TZX3_PENVA|nr:putative alcohol dehydrogenase [Penaeus vannamei]
MSGDSSAPRKAQGVCCFPSPSGPKPGFPRGGRADRRGWGETGSKREGEGERESREKGRRQGGRRKGSREKWEERKRGRGVTAAQVLLRFLVQQGLIAIPKSVTPSRIAANFDVWNFSLTDTEMAALRSLDKGPSGRSFLFGDRPGMKDHPECPA